MRLGIFIWPVVVGGVVACSARSIQQDTGSGQETGGFDESSSTSTPGGSGSSDGSAESDDGVDGSDDGCGGGGCPQDVGGGPDDGINVDCGFAPMPAGATPLGGPCTDNEHCQTRVCEAFSDHPAEQGVCRAQDDGCGTFSFGTVRNMVTGEPVAGLQVSGLALLSAVANPGGAEPLGQGTTDGAGRFLVLSDAQLFAPIGYVAMVQPDANYVRTANLLAMGSAEGTYGPATDVRDVWALARTDVDAWSAALALDPSIDGQLLPLEEQGGVVFIMVDAASGSPVEGCTVSNTQNPQAYAIRYVEPTVTTLGDASTSSLGLAIVLGSGVSPTEFLVDCPGAELAAISVGSWDGAIFVGALAVST